MSDQRTNIYAENLLSAARRYGDATLAHGRNSAHYQTEAFLATRDEALEAKNDLHRAARIYATRMRKKKPASTTTPSGDGEQGT